MTTDDAQENLSLVWEALITSDAPLSAADLAAHTGLREARVRAALSGLLAADLIVATGTGNRNWMGIRTLDSAAWGRAIHLGIPVPWLERHARLAAAGALRVMVETTERWADDRTRRASQRRHAWMRGRAASVVAATELARLSNDLEAARDRSADDRIRKILTDVLATNREVLTRLREHLEGKA